MPAEDIPDQQKAFEYYLEYNKEYFSNLDCPDLMSGIKIRFYRTHPSLVRDVYFNKYIYERLNKFCEIIYNPELDVEEGIDLMIVTKKANYGICIFTKPVGVMLVEKQRKIYIFCLTTSSILKCRWNFKVV